MITYYMASTELNIAYTVGRYVWWFENGFTHHITHPHHAHKVLSLLSGMDSLLNPHLIRQHLRAHRMPYFWSPDHRHASFALHPPSWKRIINWLSIEL